MPKRYINAVEAEAQIKKLFPDIPKIDFMDTVRNWREKNKQYLQCLDVIRSLPTADVAEVKHGYFIGTEFDGYADGYPVFYEWKCSECGCIFEDEEPTYNYCPQCGAKMDGKETEDGEAIY